MKYEIIYCDDPKPFDVDGTLIIHTHNAEEHDIEVYDVVEHKLIPLRINKNMVRLLKEEHSRGSYVIVWSRGGRIWAESVVKALNLEKYVNLIMTKPKVYFDDTEVKDWLKDRVFMEPNVAYKITKQGDK